MEPINTQEPLPGGENVTPSDGGRNDGEGIELKDLLSEELGRKFETDEAALAAVKETFNYVGGYGKVKPVLDQLRTKFGDDAKVLEALNKMTQDNPTPNEPPKVDESKFVPRDVYERDNFFSKHPEFSEEQRELLEAVAAKSGKPLAEAAELPAFKNTIEKVRVAETSEKSKSVLHTNPRLAAVTDKITEAKKASQAGNHRQAASAAVGAVLDAYEQK